MKIEHFKTLQELLSCVEEIRVLAESPATALSDLEAQLRDNLLLRVRPLVTSSTEQAELKTAIDALDTSVRALLPAEPTRTSKHISDLMFHVRWDTNCRG